MIHCHLWCNTKTKTLFRYLMEHHSSHFLFFFIFFFFFFEISTPMPSSRPYDRNKGLKIVYYNVITDALFSDRDSIVWNFFVTNDKFIINQQGQGIWCSDSIFYQREFRNRSIQQIEGGTAPSVEPCFGSQGKSFMNHSISCINIDLFDWHHFKYESS